MKNFLLLILLCSTGLPAFADRMYAPNSHYSATVTKTVCQGATTTAINFKYNTCKTGSGGLRIGIPLTVTWYRNTVNSTTGGTAVATYTVTTSTGTRGTLTHVPSTADAGQFFYYCSLTWDGTGECNTTGTLTSSTTTTVIIKEAPAPITAPTTLLCVGSTTTLTDVTPYGTWTSLNTGRATVGSTSGIVTAIAAGNATIRYRTGCGTAANIIVTVITAPAAITGPSSVCTGSIITLANTVPSGTWSTSNEARATVDASTGEVTGIGAGTCTISYTSICGTYVTKTITINTAPAAITGNTDICIGTPSTLSNTVTGGTWSSSNILTASVTSGGVVTGLLTGTATITYTANTCYQTATVNVATTPLAISGSSSVCTGQTLTLGNLTANGTWSSSNVLRATVNAEGVVTGVGAGTCTITYSTGCGTAATKTITVNSAPLAISGVLSFCTGSSSTLSNATSGGNWSSSNFLIASVNATTGVVTGNLAGTATITYNAGTCSATAVVTINTTPGTITGTTSVCAGLTTTLSNSVAFGTWSSSNTARATVSAAGVVSGLTAGTCTISYSTSCGTVATRIVTINNAPNTSITGTTTVCVSATTSLGNTVSGGVWSSSATSRATVNASGVVTGVATGTATISYAIGSCVATTVVTVNPLPSAGTITGTATVCEDNLTVLSNATTGGVWSSSDETIAYVDDEGNVTGLSGGNATISYAVTNSCGTAIATRVATVTAIPTAGFITGSASVCDGATTTLSSSVSGGTWNSDDNSTATVNSTGIVTAVEAGMTDIIYTVTNSCGSDEESVTVTVNALPASISGTATICAGATTTLTNTLAGGAWSSSNTARATVGSSTGIVTGVSAGTATITYNVNGCTATRIVTVNALPSAITGALTVCTGATSTLSSATSGGTWSSSNTSIATIGSASGVASGISTGNVTITYTASGCRATAIATINTTPNAGSITGTASVCEGSTTALSNAVSGGNWSSSNTSIATVNASGVVTGVAAGNATISYSVTNGCGTANTTVAATVNALPNAGSITGTASVCEGSTTALSNAVSGGNWSSSNTSIATVNASGVVTGVATGNATISYSVTNGCGTANTTATATVNALPNAGSITGTATVCEGSTTALSNAVSGGNWSSSNTSIATVNASGVVTGVATGNATISYSVTNGCGTANTTVEATVNALPNAGSITGTASVCEGAITALSNAVSGGNWSSSNTSIATVNASGVVTGVAAGNATISYSVTNGCGTANTTVATTVNALPNAGSITGTASVCEGSTTALSNAVSGGNWSSSNTSIATVSASGMVTGVAAGNATVSYSVTNGCGTANTTTTATVNALPNAGSITGTASVCEGSTTALSNAVSGGNWSSSNTSIATVSASGVVTSVATGNATISYSVTNGCGTANTTVEATVNALPNAGSITGTTSVCEGATTALSNAVSGGNWSSSNTSIATINASGVVTGVAAGNTTISYSVTNGCGTANTTVEATVNALPNAGSITGTASVCEGATTALNNAINGGNWNSSNTGIATVNASGVVTGVAAGNATISYSVTNGCGTANTTVEATVNALPSAITGTLSACVGSTTNLSNAVSGGEWSSSLTAIATIDATTGIATAIATGNTTITYTTGGGCTATATLSVNALPNPITGTTTFCAGSTSALSSSTTGGVWSSSDAAVATIGTNGIVTAVSAGNSTISYTLATGCARTTTVTITSGAGTLSGTASVCTGSSTTISSSTSGGTYASSATSVATVGLSTGVVTGIAAGTTTITYTVSGGCRSTIVVTVKTTPANITGTTRACPGTSTTLANSTTGGTWSSANTSIHTVDINTGVVTGVSAGTALVSYSTGIGCYKTTNVTINPTPAAIAGTTSACQGSTTTLSDATTPLVSWVSNNTAVATINGMGVVNGVSAGTATITYTAGSGCTTTTVVTINPLPAVISGTLKACPGTTTSLSNTVTGGTWASQNTSIATIDGTNGVATGITAGNSVITYTLSTGCRRTGILTVNPLPAAIGGVATTCVGTTTTLTGTGGGTWSSQSTSIATVGATGIVTGVAAGNTNITYTLATGCQTTRQVTITPAPSAISGASSVCIAMSTTLSNTISGGTWSSSNTAMATVNASGIVTGVVAGNVTITYAIGTGCRATKAMTVSTSQAITGINNACNGLTTTLANGVGGGTWSSNNSSVASVSSTGVVSGVSAGTANISYTTANGCSRTMAVTIYETPGAFTGASSVCTGQAATISNAVTGGTWSASVPGTLTVDASTGAVSGVAAGTGTITYSFSANCRTTKVFTVNNSPAFISGPTGVCLGGTCTLSNSTTGGTWNTGDPAIATIGGDGTVSGVGTGTTPITYVLSNGCFRTAVVTVSPTNEISGDTTICEDGTITISSTTTGGTWTSTSEVVVTPITADNALVSAASVGVATITYTALSGCSSTSYITVNPTPEDITGPGSVCTGSTITLADATAGGDWSSSNTSVATIAPTGIVNGISAGNATISYAVTNACGVFIVTKEVTVNTTPNAGSITGDASVCQSATSALSTTGAGGAWSSSNTSIATVNSSGVVTGVAEGNATISYSVTNGCGSDLATVAATVNPAPAVGTISGTATVCPGNTTALAISSGTGAWSSASTGVATVNSSGVVTGVSIGTAIISYTATNSCGSLAATLVVTVNASAPSAGTITGAGALCAGNTMTLSNTTTGGVWSSANTAQATVSSTGVVTGIAYGNPVISYSVSNSCGTGVATAVVNVRVTPAPITGPGFVPVGGNISLTQPVGGGSWSCSHPSVAAVNSTGTVTGVTPGRPIISYTMTNICGTNTVTTQVTVAQPGSWLGLSNTDWNDASNWFDNLIPNDTLNVIIAPSTYMPTISSGTAYAKRLEVAPGAALNISSSAVLNVKGNLVNNGAIIGTGVTVLNGTSTQSLSGHGRISNLTVDNNASITTNAGDTVGITGTLLLNSGTLTTNSRLLLVSNAAGTGRIGTITGGTINGNVVVQQYVQGGRRAYRFWGHPFSSYIPLSQLTPYIDITGVGGSANGFTNTSTNAASCFWYNSYISNSTMAPDPGWVEFTNTNGATEANKFKPYEGIRLFIRGKKGEGLAGATGYTPSPVTIQMYGPVNTGTINVTMAKGTATASGESIQDYNVIANPYPSPVDLGTIAKNAYDAGKIAGSSFWVWNPYLGTSGQFQAIPIDGTPYYIEANASFEIRTTADGNALTFTEANKASTYGTTLLKTKSDFLTLKIYDEDYKAWDMVHVNFNENATNEEDVKLDAVKPASPADLNFYSIAADKKKMNIDARPYAAGNVIPLGITSNNAQEFIMRADNISIPEGGQVYLYDKYLQQSTLIELGTEYRFHISEDSLTQGEGRFELRMSPAKATDVVAATNTEVTLTPNPAKNDVTLNYATKNAQEATVTVSNIAGEVLIAKDLGASKNGKVNIAVQNLPAGVYMVTFVSGNEKITQKLVKD